MAIAEMKKIAVIGLEAVKANVISDIMELGAVEISGETADDAVADSAERDAETSAGSGDMRSGVAGDESGTAAQSADRAVSQISRRLSAVSQALGSLKRYSTAKSPLFSTRRQLGRKEFEDTMRLRGRMIDEADEILQLQRKHDEIRDAVSRKRAELAVLEPWMQYSVPLELRETEHTVIERGMLPAETDMDQLTELIYEKHHAVEIKEISRDRKQIYLAVISLRNCIGEVSEVLRKSGYTPAESGDLTGSSVENAELIRAEIRAGEAEIRRIDDQLTELCSCRKELETLHDALTAELDAEKVALDMRRTQKTFRFEGWVPVFCLNAVERVLEKHGCCFAVRTPDESETVPVLLQNDGLADPFEAVTEMYSLPDYRGVDPTRPMAVFYAVFFGMMLSDAGYGLVMAAVCFAIIKKYAPEGMSGRMVRMFFLCGLSTVFWGAMFGGWFGDFFQVAADVIFSRKITIEPLWFDPLADPARLLVWSLAFGIIHLFFGMGIRASMLIKRGQWKDAMFDVLPWYMVITGGVMWLAGSRLGSVTASAGIIMLSAGLLILLLAGGQNSHGAGRITGGLSSLYGITGYVSDILSYSRLLALGLATGVIASVVNTMGSLAGGGAAGTAVLLIVATAGHSFNLAINALGAFVHAGRLQYIEFFGKFYEDGGKRFEPLRRNTKYIRITDDADGGKK